MKIVLSVLLFCISLFSLDFSLEMVKGKYRQNDEQNISRATIYGVRNNIYFTPSFALSLKYDIVDNKKVDNTNRLSMGFRFQATSLDEDFQPFLDFGYGKEIGFSRDKFYQLVLGAKYYITYEFNLLGEANYIKKRGKSQSYMFGLGIGYDFYRKPTLSKYSQKPLDIESIKNLSKRKDYKQEDIFLVSY